MPERLQKPDATKMTMDQFTKHLTKTTSSIFSPTPPRELIPPRDPTPPRDESKRKEKELGILPPLELSTFGVLINDKKRKRSSEILKEVFMNKDIVVDEMHRNLVFPSEVERRKGLVIMELESDAREDVVEPRIIVKDNFDGLGQHM
ncbi:hypothetical protein Tco_1073191 [Tanacetum coccineum]|uniref:Uncharacterized protein n=1 Tax=Tanacetum coccineum TaxID=301880 RepID=A0ABQ5IQV4_9ASTR